MKLLKEDKNEAADRMKPNYDPRDQLAFDVLAEFGVATSNAITEILGEMQAEASVRTEMQHGGLAAALNIKNRMGFEGQDLLYATYASNWTNIVWVDLKVEMTSIGFRWTTTSCPWSRASDALCCHLEHIPKAIAEVFAPEYIVSNPKRLSRGDDTCLCILAKEGVDPDQVLIAPCLCEPLPPPLDLEEMVLWNHSYMGSMWVMVLKSMLNEIGPEMTMSILAPRFKGIGREFANRITEEYRISTDDLSSVWDGLNSFHSSFLKKGRFKKSSGGFVMITEECPYSGEPTEVCQLYQCFYDGFLEEINPEFIMSNSMMMTRGDKTCHWAIRKKGEVAKERAKVETILDDPAKTLAMRFAKGEITEEEYRKKLAVLKELNP
jgi:hypothetical protein